MIAPLALVHALAAQLAIVSHGPRTVAACEAVELSVAVSAPGSVAPRVLLPPLGPFELLRTNVRPTVTQTPAGATIMVEHTYVVTTDRVGSFTIGPFEARLGGAIARSRPMRIEVQGGRAEGTVPAVVTQAHIDTSLDVNFRALALPETVYVGQQANYQVAVFLSEVVRDRLRRNPTFFPPDMQSMLSYDLPVAKGDAPRRRVGRRCFDALVYQRAVFPLMPGRFVVPPAQLTYSLALTPSFFSREESHELRTDSAVIVAIEPPRAFRPPDYSGAVGDLRVAARLDTVGGRVGDPLTLSISVEGAGNVKLFPRPSVSIPWATLVPGEERVSVDTSTRRIHGVKHFDWILTPHRAGELELPPLRYTFFNPDGRRYETATTAPIRVSIAPGAIASADTVASEQILAIRTLYRGPLGPSPFSRPEYWLLLAVAPLPAIFFGARRRERRPRSVNRVRDLRSAVAGRGPPDPTLVRRAFIAAVAQRLSVDADVLARVGGVERMLRHAGVSNACAADAERFLRTLERAAYSDVTGLPANAGRHALAIYRQIDREAVQPWELGPRGTLGIVVAIGLATTALASAMLVETPRDLFAAGVRAYVARDYDAAQRAFAAVASQEPRAPDAWANLGTAAWTAGDTARAVAGWQRSLRLEPLANDVRWRLRQVRDDGFGSVGFVIPVTLGALAIALALCWWATWTAVTMRVRRRTTIRPAAWFAAGTLVLGLATIQQTERLHGRDIVVLSANRPLVISPALGADPIAQAELGDVARVRAVHGVWSRIDVDGRRSGWIETAHLIPVTVPTLD